MLFWEIKIQRHIKLHFISIYSIQVQKFYKHIITFWRGNEENNNGNAKVRQLWHQ